VPDIGTSNAMIVIGRGQITVEPTGNDTWSCVDTGNGVSCAGQGPVTLLVTATPEPKPGAIPATQIRFTVQEAAGREVTESLVIRPIRPNA
jgi:hypothetical protein